MKNKKIPSEATSQRRAQIICDLGKQDSSHPFKMLLLQGQKLTKKEGKSSKIHFLKDQRNVSTVEKFGRLHLRKRLTNVRIFAIF